MLCVICAFYPCTKDIGACMLVDMYDLYFMYCKFYVVPSKQFNLPMFTFIVCWKTAFQYIPRQWFWPLIID